MDKKRIFAGDVTLEELCRMNQEEGYEFILEDGKITGMERVDA